MMRRTSLARRTPLVARTSLVRGGGLNPVSRKRAADNAKRTRNVSAMRRAAKGQCARCGRRDLPVHGHERLARAHGGDIVNPDCLLDNLCNQWAEDNPQIAAWTGWKVSSKWPTSPDLAPWEAWDVDGNVVNFTVLYDEDVA